MRYKTFGNTTRKVSELGMGTYYDVLWIVGARAGHHSGSRNKLEALKAGIQGGINLIDTAEIYGSEWIVGEAIKDFNREELFLASKVWHNHLRADALVRSANQSLKELGTDYLDLYQVHFPNPKVPIAETMAALEGLVDAGKIRHIGLSNFSLEQVKEASAALKRYQLSSLQLPYNLKDREVEHGILDYCKSNNLALLAYYPLAHGNLMKDPALDGLAKRAGAKPSQLALRWLADKENVFPIPRASTREHVAENVAASDLSLTEEVAAELNAIK